MVDGWMVDGWMVKVHKKKQLLVECFYGKKQQKGKLGRREN